MPNYLLETLFDFSAVICLNGDLPSVQFFYALPSTIIRLIAVDGAANKLVAMGITPRVIIGDLDSVDLSNFTSMQDKGPEIVKIMDQNYCDFEKAVHYLACISEIEGCQAGIVPLFKVGKVLVLGVSGGNFDHMLSNLNLIVRMSSGMDIFSDHVQADITFYAPPIWGFIVKPGEERLFRASYNTKVSLFGFAGTVVKTKGLKWELNGDILDFPGFNSSFNRVMAADYFVVKVDISARCGVVVMIYEVDVLDCGVDII